MSGDGARLDPACNREGVEARQRRERHQQPSGIDWEMSVSFPNSFCYAKHATPATGYRRSTVALLPLRAGMPTCWRACTFAASSLPFWHSTVVPASTLPRGQGLGTCRSKARLPVSSRFAPQRLAAWVPRGMVHALRLRCVYEPEVSRLQKRPRCRQIFAAERTSAALRRRCGNRCAAWTLFSFFSCLSGKVLYIGGGVSLFSD